MLGYSGCSAGTLITLRFKVKRDGVNGSMLGREPRGWSSILLLCPGCF